MSQEQLIEKYFQGTLSKEEALEFNSLYDNNDQFKAEVQWQKKLANAIAQTEKETFKSKLEEFEQETNISETKPNKRLWLVAASIIILLTIGGFWMFKPPLSQNLAQQNFNVYPNTAYPIVRGDMKNDIKSSAFIAYETENYSKAIALFTEANKIENKLYYKFYIANAQMAQNNYEEAIPYLLEVVGSNEAYTQESTWYLALAYLQTGDTQAAKSLLTQIVRKKWYNAERASEILKKLK